MLPTGKFTSPANLLMVRLLTSYQDGYSNWVTDRSSDSSVEYGLSSVTTSPLKRLILTRMFSHSVELNNLSAGTTLLLSAPMD